MSDKRQLNHYLLIPVIALSMTGLFSCGSKKSVVENPQPYTPPTIITGDTTNETSTTQSPHSTLRLDQQRLVNEALTWLGVPYRYGGEDRDGTDCSGLSMTVYKTALGIKLPRKSADQQKFCSEIPQSQLEVGDLVFFITGSDKSRVSHVGIYLGSERFIHSSSSKGVIISDISSPYYSRAYYSSGHVERQTDSINQSETAPLKFEFNPDALDRAIEARIDSIGGF